MKHMLLGIRAGSFIMNIICIAPRNCIKGVFVDVIQYGRTTLFFFRYNKTSINSMSLNISFEISRMRMGINKSYIYKIFTDKI